MDSADTGGGIINVILLYGPDTSRLLTTVGTDRDQCDHKYVAVVVTCVQGMSLGSAQVHLSRWSWITPRV